MNIRFPPCWRVGLLAALCLTGHGHAADNAALPADRERFHIFLLMGQSNMSGVAPLEPGDEKPVAGVYYLPTISTNGLAWLPAHHPLHKDQVLERIDRIYFAGKVLQVVDAGVVGESRKTCELVHDGPWPSDHRAVAATFEIVR